MQSKAATVEQYLASLPESRRAALQAVRDVVLRHIDGGYQEGMQYGMIGYFVPHAIYPAGYHCDPKQPLPYMGMASQKNHMSVYLFCLYGHDDSDGWFHKAWAKTGRKLDMGKCCIRFRKLEDLALDVIAEAIKRTPVKKFIAHYESAILTMNKAAAARSAAKKKSTSKKAAPRKTSARKSAVGVRTARGSDASKGAAAGSRATSAPGAPRKKSRAARKS